MILQSKIFFLIDVVLKKMLCTKIPYLEEIIIWWVKEQVLYMYLLHD